MVADVMIRPYGCALTSTVSTLSKPHFAAHGVLWAASEEVWSAPINQTLANGARSTASDPVWAPVAVAPCCVLVARRAAPAYRRDPQPFGSPLVAEPEIPWCEVRKRPDPGRLPTNTRDFSTC